MLCDIECPNCNGSGEDVVGLTCRRCKGHAWLSQETLAKTRDDFNVGFTGTQEGMAAAQVETVHAMLRRLVEAHGDRLRALHGDCVGADFQFDDLCRLLGIWRGVFPSNITAKRAFCERRGAVELATPQPPLERNPFIFKLGRDLLIAGPKGMAEEQRSGTWATVRGARKRFTEKRRGRIVVAWPDGRGEFVFPEGERRAVALTPPGER
jgi:hypothetical protein